MARKIPSSAVRGGSDTAVLEPPAGSPLEVSIDSIELDHRNDRLKDTFDKEAIDELAASIKAVGLQHPIGVAPGSKKNTYRLVYGHRRLAAAKKAGLESLPAMLRAYKDDDEIQTARAVENVHRQDLNPVEEAIAVAALIDQAMGQSKDAGDEPDTVPNTASRRSAAITLVAQRLGKSETWVRDRAFVARLSEKARKLVLAGRLPLAHAREISKLADPNLMDQIAEEMAAGGAEEQPRDLDDVRFEVSKSLFSLAQVPWKLDVPFAKQIACTTCPHNSANNHGLFEHSASFSTDLRDRGGFGTKKEPATGVCMLHSCFATKTASAKAAVRSSTEKAIRVAEKEKTKKVNAATIAKVTPEYLKPATVAGQVKKKLEAAPKKKTARRASYHDDWNSPKNQAKRAWEDAQRERDDSIVESVKTELRKTPGALLMLELIANTDTFRQTRSNGKKAEPAKARVRALLKAATAPTWEGMLELAKGLEFYVNTYQWREAGMIGDLAAAVGIKTLPPEPKLEEFNAKFKVGEKKNGKADAAGKSDDDEEGGDDE